MFTARYEMGLEIKQTALRLQRVKEINYEFGSSDASVHEVYILLFVVVSRLYEDVYYRK